MYSRRTTFRMASTMLLAVASAITASSSGQTPRFASVPPLPFDDAGPVIRAHAEAQKPFTVAGERGVLAGRQDGTFEAWLLPIKLLSHLTIEADIEGYDVPIDVNRQAAEIEVRPDRTIITYSHAGFTVRQIMFSPNDAPEGTGPIVLFEFDCLHPTEFTLRFTPNLQWMWPERNEGVPSVEWDAKGAFYILHSDYPDLAGAVTIPGAQPGILAPYQERAASPSCGAEAAHRPRSRQGQAFSAVDGRRHQSCCRHRTGPRSHARATQPGHRSRLQGTRRRLQEAACEFSFDRDSRQGAR